MSASLRTFTLAGLVAVSGLFAPGCIIVADDDNVLTIENDSRYFLDEIYIADNGDIDWGPNLAPSDGLGPGEAMDVELDCGTYDLLVIDNTGADCDEFGLDLCLGDQDVFVFRNTTCDTFEAALKAAAEKSQKDAGEAQKAAPAPLL
jgi:hypothetical protein